MTKEQMVDGYIKEFIGKKLVLVRKARKGVRKPLYRKMNIYRKVPTRFLVSQQDKELERAWQTKVKKHWSHQEFNTATSHSGYQERKSKIRSMMR